MYIDVAAAVLTAAIAGHHGSVTVQPGDSLSGIAARYCGDPDRYPGLAAASHIPNPDLIYPGQRVTLACHAATTGQVRPAGRHRAVTASRGATLRDLAQRYCGTPADYPGLAAASGITNPDVISAGQRVTISCTTIGPHSQTAAPAAVPAPARRGRHARTSTSTSGYHRSGSYSYDGLRQLWISAGGPASAADQAARIAQCESGGRANAYNPSGATGVWQILGQVRPGNLNDPGVNAANAVAKYRASGGNFSQWVCKG